MSLETRNICVERVYWDFWEKILLEEDAQIPKIINAWFSKWLHNLLKENFKFVYGNKEISFN